MALLLLAACGEASTGAATGPAPVSDPTSEVALLAVVEGQVTIRDAQGAETTARPEMSLRRGDTVVTTPGSLAVVVLANGYVLKLGEDQSTPVRALAHLDDPPPAESVAELFEKALGAEAFARVGGADRLERIAGWNARRASGETPAPVAKRDAPLPPAKTPAPIAAEEEKAADAKALDAPLDAPERGRVDADDAPVETDVARPKKKSASPAPKPSTKSGPAEQAAGQPDDEAAKDAKRAESAGASPPGAPAPSGDASAADLADSWIFETGPERQVTRTSLPEALKAQRKALAQCVAAAAPGVAAPELRLEVAGGAIRSVALGGDKPAPACARGLVGRAVAGVGDGWMIVRVRR